MFQSIGAWFSNNTEFAVLVIIGTVIFFLLPARPRPRPLGGAAPDLDAVAARAEALGWKFERKHDLSRGYAIVGALPSGAPWKLTYSVQSDESGTDHRLEWRTTSVKAKQTELLIAGKAIYAYRKNPMMSVSTGLAAGAAKLFQNDSGRADTNKWIEDLATFLWKARECAMGSARFRERFVVAALSGAESRLTLDGELEKLICDWPRLDAAPFDAEQRFAAWLEAMGLRIEFEIEDPPLPIVEHFVRVGIALAARIR